MRSFRATFFFLLLIILTNCKENNRTPYCNGSFQPSTWDRCMEVEFVFDDFEILELEDNELPYATDMDEVPGLSYYDQDSLPLHDLNGSRSYHPVQLAQHALNVLDVYDSELDSSTLNYLHSIRQKLLEISVNQDSALYFPYSFDFSLHGCQEETMIAPWYSGMAQGQVLSFFCRMFSLTSDSTYFNDSKRVFKSFTQLKGEGFPTWVSCIDKHGNLWLEEYPRNLPCFTLNGKIFAIFGIYDFYLITRDKRAKEMLQAALTTVKENLPKYRVVNEFSYYCLKHKNFNVQNEGYHFIHIEQLYLLEKITGDEYFGLMAENFVADAKALGSQ